MGIDAMAQLGYGFKVKDKSIVSKLEAYMQDEESEFFDDFDLQQVEIVCSEEYGGGNTGDFAIFVAKSEQCIFHYDEITKLKLDVKPGWDQFLLDFAKKYKIKNPKIGWYWTVSLS